MTARRSQATFDARIDTVLRGALRQALIELRVQLLSPMLASWLIMPGTGLLVLYFLRGFDVLDSAVSVAQLGVPGILTMTIITSGLLGVAGQLITERDDGTLLRAKAVPGGMSSRLLGDVLVNMGTAMGPMLLLVAVAALLFEGVTPNGPLGWLTLLWVSILGLLATLPFGAVFGALLRDPMLLWTVGMAVYGGLAISGVFYPIQAMPEWVQTLGQMLPLYWIGLGLRHAMLPADAVTLEIGESWRVAETVGVLGAWAVLGLILAPIALRRMARRQSGSNVSAARDRVLSRGY